MKIPPVTIDVRKGLTMVLNVKLKGVRRVRLFLRVVKFSAWVLGVGVQVEM